MRNFHTAARSASSHPLRTALQPAVLLAVLVLGLASCNDSAEESSQSLDVVTTRESSVGDAFGTGSMAGVAAPSRGIASDMAGPQPAPPPAPDAAMPPQTPGSAEPPSGASIIPPMLIRTGNSVIEVDSLEIAISEVRLLAQRMGGFIANTSMQTGQGEIRSATMEMKLPANRFDEAVGGLTTLGKVESTNVQSDDVGEEYVDLTARMENARRLEERLISLLANRTGKLEEVLAVERELARVREQIERYEGRMRYLRTRSAISTLTVTVHEPRPLIGSNPGRSIIGEAFRGAWRNFVRFTAGLIEAMGVLIPLAILGLAGWLLWRRFGPRFQPPRPGGPAA